MARKPRIEYAGAVYHVISRGNYRKDLFNIGKSGEAFEKALFESVDRCGWKLHAYVIMSNHYHLALELTEPNLVEGMRWLQSTFANRFNKFTGERGHVFQGRYKAILIEPDRPLLGLVNYIHLNPVRAGIVDIENLIKYKLSSYPKFFKKEVRSGLERKKFLSLKSYPGSVYGMKKYAEYLEHCKESDMSQKSELSQKYCRGWILAEKKFKEEILKSYQSEQMSERVPFEGRRELKEAHWESKISELLEHVNKTNDDIEGESKGIQWKVLIAREMRNKTTVTNSWLAERLNMGHPSRVSNLIYENI